MLGPRPRCQVATKWKNRAQEVLFENIYCVQLTTFVRAVSFAERTSDVLSGTIHTLTRILIFLHGKRKGTQPLWQVLNLGFVTALEVLTGAEQATCM